MKHILIPTDFSENAHNAIRYALAYFADTPVKFYILHVSVKEPVYQTEAHHGFLETAPEVQIAIDTTAQLKEEIKKCRSWAINENHVFISLYEDLSLVEAIRKQVAQKEIDYILMATKGASKMNFSEMGSNTYDVVTKVKCPILVIPENARFKGIGNVAFVTDYNCLYRNRVINTLSDTLELLKSPLRVLYIKTQDTGLTAVQKDNKGFLHYFFKEKKHSFHFLQNKNIETGIQDFVEIWDISLVSIVAKNLNFIQRLLLRPTAKKVSYHTDVPFLVLHE